MLPKGVGGRAAEAGPGSRIESCPACGWPTRGTLHRPRANVLKSSYMHLQWCHVPRLNTLCTACLPPVRPGSEALALCVACHAYAHPHLLPQLKYTLHGLPFHPCTQPHLQLLHRFGPEGLQVGVDPTSGGAAAISGASSARAASIWSALQRRQHRASQVREETGRAVNVLGAPLAEASSTGPPYRKGSTWNNMSK